MCSRAEIALSDGRLMGVTRELNVTTEDEGALSQTLTGLERELRDINTTVAHKHRLLQDYLTSGFTGSQWYMTLSIMGEHIKMFELGEEVGKTSL